MKDFLLPIVDNDQIVQLIQQERQNPNKPMSLGFILKQKTPSVEGQLVVLTQKGIEKMIDTLAESVDISPDDLSLALIRIQGKFQSEQDRAVKLLSILEK